MRSSLKDVDCSVAQTLEIVGEWWTFMILRNIFLGLNTFDLMQENLDMSTSVLSARLKKLVDNDVLEKRQSPEDGRSFSYHLTDRGFDLYPIMVGLMQWGEKWTPNGRGRRIALIEKETGAPVAGAYVMAADGRSLHARDVRVAPGPGADTKMKQALMQQAKD